MIKTTYNIKEFDPESAREGALCIVVDKNLIRDDIPNEGVPVDSISQEQGSENYIKNPDIKGVGIAKFSSQGQFEITVDGSTYVFNKYGQPKDSYSSKYKLYLADIKSDIVTNGSTVKSNISVVNKLHTRQDDGKIESEIQFDYDNGSDVKIDSLNARDQIALQAMRGFLSHIPKPENLSSNEIDYYAGIAYKWAASMMAEAAKTRIIVDDTEVEATGTSPEKIVYLETNEEKLLNNLIYALEKTDKKETEDGKDVYYERITIPELNKIFEDFLKGEGDTKLGFKNLLDAVKEIDTDMKSKFDLLVTEQRNIVSKLDTLNSTIGSYLSALNSTLSTIDTRLSSMETKVNNVQDNVTSMRWDLSDINSDISSINNNIGGIESDISSINGDISSIGADISSIKDKLDK